MPVYIYEGKLETSELLPESEGPTEEENSIQTEGEAEIIMGNTSGMAVDTDMDES